MKNIFIVLLLVGIVNSTKLSSSSEEDKEKDNLVTSKNGNKIEQCECSKIHECFEVEHALFRPCIDECADKLEHPDWIKKKGIQCFVLKGKPHKEPACLQESKNLTSVFI